MRLTDRELATAPPHQVDHEVVSDRTSGGGGGGTEDAQGNATLFRYAGGPGGSDAMAVAAAGGPTLLMLAVQVSSPEDPGTAEGKLVQTLQEEEGPLSTRVKALKVRAPALLVFRGCDSSMETAPGGQVGGEEKGESRRTKKRRSRARTATVKNRICW